MAQIGFLSSIYEAASFIDLGRKGFAIIGKEREGRISFEKGIAQAMAAFQEAQTTANPQAIILAEFTFISQELQFCHETDKASIGSLTQAIQSFDDAFLALKVVEELDYKTAEQTYPHHKDYRISGFPLDAFHVACKSHRTRLQNILKAPGIDPIEKDLLKQRFANLSTAQNSYIEKQRKALLPQIKT